MTSNLTIKTLPPEYLSICKIFEAMGDNHRQIILMELNANNELSYSIIKGFFNLSRSALNHHLASLVSSGLVTKEKRGKEVYFSINKVPLRGALTQILELID